MPDLSVNIHDLILKNPVTTASGTYAYGKEFQEFYDLSRLGGIFVKAVSLEAREGNRYPRMAETPSGMLNAIGLQNKGLDYFVDNIYPDFSSYGTQVFANVVGHSVDDYVCVSERINSLDNIAGIELNISCPNVKDGMVFGTNAKAAAELTKAVRKVYHKTLMVKLSPNVTDICEVARAIEAEGADVLTLINTLMGMAIDAEKRKPVLSTITGGLSGPAIKPVALRMVYQVHKAVKLPLIGIGGIMTATDAIEFLLAGATAVQVGTANFINPMAAVDIIEGIEDYMKRHGIENASELVGALKV
ncbi:MAG: dihydroorotate dehydrogenase [Bacteroidota bacterium]